MNSSEPEPKDKAVAADAGPRLEPDDVAPAVADVAYSLTHDLSDTPQDIRDALAFAPIALAKTLARGWSYLASRPFKTATVLGGLLISSGLAGMLLRRRRRSKD